MNKEPDVNDIWDSGKESLRTHSTRQDMWRDCLHWSFYTHKNLAQGIEWVQSIKSQGRLFDNATLIQDH